MASNKNQHFVPRCYLRPFTAKGDGLAINLFNVDKDKFIQNAPVKGQCSGDYFYGEDLRLEKALQGYEGLYARVLKDVLHHQYVLTHDCACVLRDFCALQYLRTEAASRRSVEMSISVESVAALPPHTFRTGIREAVQTSMEMFPHSRQIIEDLKVCLVRNRTNIPFVTSDDPAVLTNRLHLQHPRLLGVAPGLGSAGAIFFLPLSKDVLFIAYDGGIYTIPHSRGWIDVKREQDIEAFNQHQFLNCRANIYFGEWDKRESAIDGFKKIADRRPNARHRVNYAILEHEDGGVRTFRVVDKAADHLGERALIHVEGVLAEPSRWPSQIGRRADGYAYANGSATGLIRRGVVQYVEGSDYRKLRVRDLR